MKRSVTSVLLSVVLVLSLALTAWAGSLKFNGGVSIGTLDLSFIAKGLGNDVLSLEVTADAVYLVTCTNQGGEAASGVNEVSTPAEAKGEYDSEQNGRVEDALMVSDPGLTGAQLQSGCPNANWAGSLFNWTDDPDVSPIPVYHWSNIKVVVQHDSLDEPDELYFDCEPGALPGDACVQVDSLTE